MDFHGNVREPYTKRLPVFIIEDNSDSTKYIKATLNSQMRSLIRQLKYLSTVNNTVDLNIIHYSNQGDYQFKWSGPLRDVPEDAADIVAPRGTADSGTALLQLLRDWQNMKRTWDLAGGSTAPVILFLTDGPSTAGKTASAEEKRNAEENFRQACDELTMLQQTKTIRFAAVGISHIRQYCAKKEELLKLTADAHNVFLAEEDFDGLDLGQAIKWLLEAVTQTAIESMHAVMLENHENRHIRGYTKPAPPPKNRNPVPLHDPAREPELLPQQPLQSAVPPVCSELIQQMICGFLQL